MPGTPAVVAADTRIYNNRCGCCATRLRRDWKKETDRALPPAKEGCLNRPQTQENLMNLMTAAKVAVVVKLYQLEPEPDTTLPVVKRLRT